MAYELYYGMADDDTAKVAYLMQLFAQSQNLRTNFDVQWEEAASIYLPEYRNSWSFGHNRPPGVKYQQYQVDSTGAIAANRFMAIGNALCTPHTMQWSVYRPVDHQGRVNAELWKERDVQIYYSQLTNLIWSQRYRPEANFLAAQLQNWLCLGVFGNQSMFVDKLDTAPGEFKRGIRYIPVPPGAVYLLRDHQARTTGCIRHFRWLARQAHQKWPGEIPPQLVAALQQNSSTMFDFLHFILPRTDYDPWKILAPQGKRYWSCYVSVTGWKILEEGGYNSFPLPHGDYTLAPEEDYGRGPGQQVLAEAKTLNAQKTDYLALARGASRPAYLLPTDGVLDFKTQPGAFNYGAINSQGQELVKPLGVGNFQIAEAMLADSKAIVNSAFLVDLFPMLFDQKGGQRSAREVIEVANQMGIFLGPTLGRQFGEYLGTLARREIDVLDDQGLLPKLPNVMREARGEFEHGTVFVSPLARSLAQTHVAGYMRAVEFTREVVNITGDPAPLDNFDFDTAIPAIAEAGYVPPEWMSDRRKMAAVRQQRAKAAEADRQVKMLPGQAAIMKAKAISDKAQTGGNTGGTLSGQPEGAMPMMPGQNQPGGRAFGQPGPQPGQPGGPLQ